MSSSELLGILVMLNNYFHDLAVAILFISVLVSWWLWRERRGLREGSTTFSSHLIQRLSLVTRASLVWIVLGGIVRTITYRDYEWLAAVGRGQVPALVIKHVLLVSMVAVGLYFHFKLLRCLSSRGAANKSED